MEVQIPVMTILCTLKNPNTYLFLTSLLRSVKLLTFQIMKTRIRKKKKIISIVYVIHLACFPQKYQKQSFDNFNEQCPKKWTNLHKAMRLN